MIGLEESKKKKRIAAVRDLARSVEADDGVCGSSVEETILGLSCQLSSFLSIIADVSGILSRRSTLFPLVVETGLAGSGPNPSTTPALHA